MAKEKRVKTDYEAKAMEFFADNPIEAWEAYIKAEADAEKADMLKLYAERKLTIPKMKAYIETYANTPENRKEFKQNTYGIQYEKDDKGEYVLKDGEKVPVMKDGKPVMKQSIVYAKKYFIPKYAKYLERDIKPKTKAFDALLDW